MMIELAEERCKLCSCCTKLQIVNTCACINALEIISLHASLIVRGTEIGSHWVNCNFFSPAKTFSIYIELLAKQLTLRCYIFNYSTTCNKVAKAVKQCSIHFLSVELWIRRYNEETKFSVTPSFVLTHSSDSIFLITQLQKNTRCFTRQFHGD